jgi:Fe-S cluster biogenesis protein NfuA
MHTDRSASSGPLRRVEFTKLVLSFSGACFTCPASRPTSKHAKNANLAFRLQTVWALQ